jgi:hypothetical protein
MTCHVVQLLVLQVVTVLLLVVSHLEVIIACRPLVPDGHPHSALLVL